MPTINDETLLERYQREHQDYLRISDDDCLFDVDEAAWNRIVSKRGGCRCCISPPCPACTEPITEDELNSVGYTYEAPAARFPEVSCSQCGQSFGPGDSGFSHCRDHQPATQAAPMEIKE